MYSNASLIYHLSAAPHKYKMLQPDILLRFPVSASQINLDTRRLNRQNSPRNRTMERWLSWSKALDSKSSVAEMSPWVRIPLSPLI